MKAWEEAKIEDLSIELTAQGGKTPTTIDLSWNDEDGYAHSRFQS